MRLHWVEQRFDAALQEQGRRFKERWHGNRSSSVGSLRPSCGSPRLSFSSSAAESWRRRNDAAESERQRSGAAERQRQRSGAAESGRQSSWPAESGRPEEWRCQKAQATERRRREAEAEEWPCKPREAEERARREREAEERARWEAAAAERRRREREAEERCRREREAEERANRERWARWEAAAEELRRREREAEKRARREREAEAWARWEAAAEELRRKEREAEERARLEREADERAAAEKQCRREQDAEEPARREREAEAWARWEAAAEEWRRREREAEERARREREAEAWARWEARAEEWRRREREAEERAHPEPEAEAWARWEAAAEEWRRREREAEERARREREAESWARWEAAAEEWRRREREAEERARPEREAEERRRELEAAQATLQGDAVRQVPWFYVLACTRDFADGLVVGQGAYGAVYRATDADALPPMQFAVKRLVCQDAERMQALLRATDAEISALSTFRHPNIIRLLAFAIEGEDRALIYEYEPNGSLAEHLTDDRKAQALTWPPRANIASGLAKALNYMHTHDPSGPCYHRDVKPANVMLTAAMSPKLIDCGLARFVPPGAGPNRRTALVSTQLGLVGTQGYMCPRYVQTSEFRRQSEVFSFGVTLIELLVGQVQSYVVADLVGETEAEAIFGHRDPRPEFRDRHECAVRALAELAAGCVEPRLSRRIPDMAAVVRQAMAVASEGGMLPESSGYLSAAVESLAAELQSLRAQMEAAVMRQLAAERPCQICFNSHAAGLACARAHFVCAEDAAEHVRTYMARLGQDDLLLQQHRGRGGRLRCVHPDCPELYSDQALARVLPDEVFALYRASCDQATENRLWADMNARFQARLAEAQAAHRRELAAARREQGARQADPQTCQAARREQGARQADPQTCQAEERSTAEFLRRTYPNARMCPQCRRGPVINENCFDLQAHHGEAEGRSRISNACPSCGFFTPDWNEWLPWDGSMP